MAIRSQTLLFVFSFLVLTASVVIGCIVEDFGQGGVCSPRFANGFPCPDACDASNVVIIDGDSYCTTTCGDGNECPSGHLCVRFAPEDNPSSACLPPCSTGADCPSGFLGICDDGACGL